jgi:hypothetical protein
MNLLYVCQLHFYLVAYQCKLYVCQLHFYLVAYQCKCAWLQACAAMYIRPVLSGILHTVEWYFCTDVSEQPIGPIFKGLGLLDPCRVVIFTDVSGQRIDPIFKGLGLLDLCQVVVLYRRFGTNYRLNLQGSWASWSLKTRPIGCPEMSVQDRHSTLRNITEQRSSECKFVRSTQVQTPLDAISVLSAWTCYSKIKHCR